MTDRIVAGRLKVAAVLHRFIEQEVLPASGIDSAAFWRGFDALAHELAPKNAARAGRVASSPSGRDRRPAGVPGVSQAHRLPGR
jgi:hypothetical protein